MHIRSFFGLGLVHWVLPFGLIFALSIPWSLARGDLTGTIDIAKQPEAWSEAWFGSRPVWMKRLTYGLFTYSMFFLLGLIIKNYPKAFFQDSGQELPAPLIMFFSTGWICFFWEYICTFWQVLHRRKY